MCNRLEHIGPAITICLVFRVCWPFFGYRRAERKINLLIRLDCEAEEADSLDSSLLSPDSESEEREEPEEPELEEPE